MPVGDALRGRSAELENAIERRIVERTNGRIQSLRVSVTDDQVVITGCASCFYHKQLAIQGVLSTIGDARGTRIEANIEVVSILARRNRD